MAELLSRLAPNRDDRGGSWSPISVQSKMQPTKTTTYEATVENGQIKLPEAVHLPEHTRVFVVVPFAEEERALAS